MVLARFVVASYMGVIVSAFHTDPVPNLAFSILLSDAVESHGARCLDGSPQRIWLQRSQSPNLANRSKWVLHFMGGGWCIPSVSCASRAYSQSGCWLGSSSEWCFNSSHDTEPGKPFNHTMDFRDIVGINGARWGGGLLMNSQDTNPLTHDWNKIVLSYCDGGSYSGNHMSASAVVAGPHAGLPLFFRGKRNRDATIDYLLVHENLGHATHLIVNGASAGGLAVFWHADYVQSRLPRAIVFAVPDSGFFFSDPSKPAWPAELESITEHMNSTSALDDTCVADAVAASASAFRVCTLPEDVAPHVSVPIFVMNSRFDPALHGISSYKVDYNVLGDRLLMKLNRTVLTRGRQRNAAYITSCAAHCGQWAQGQVLPGHNDFNVTIDGFTAPYAVDRWVASIANNGSIGRNLWLQNTGYPCRTCCTGGQRAQAGIYI